MGFSTGGSAALLALGLFIAFGTFQTATTEHLERVTDAKHEAGEDRLERINTEINITQTAWDSVNGNLTIRAKNEGTTVLSVGENERLDVIVDGNYTAPENYTTAVAGDTTTDLWRPGESLRVTIDNLLELMPGITPGRTKIVVEHGVSDWKEVS